MTISSTPLTDPALPPWSPMLLFSLCLSMLLSALGSSLGNVVLPALAQAWRAPFTLVQWWRWLSAHPYCAQRQRRRLSDSLGRRRFSWPASLCSALARRCVRRRAQLADADCRAGAARAGRGVHDGAEHGRGQRLCRQGAPAAPWVGWAACRRWAPRWGRRWWRADCRSGWLAMFWL